MLRFQKVRWKNLLSTGNTFTEVILDRSKTTLIVGHNGAGKSTLLEALSYALYGKPFRDVTVPLLINTINNKQMVVEIEFKSEGREYKIIRGQKPRRFEIHRNGELVNQDDKNTDYQKWLETEVLRMNHKSFKQIVILGSAGYTPFMELKADHRRVICEDILDIHVFSHMHSLLKKAIEETNDQLRDVIDTIERNKTALGIHQEHLASKRDDYEEIVRHIEQQTNNATQQIATLEAEIMTLTDQREQLTESIADQTKVVATLEQLRQIERSIEERVMNYRREVRFFSDNHVCPTCSQGIDDEFKEKTICDHSQQITTLEAGIEEVDQKKLQLSARFEEIQRTGELLTQLASDIRDRNTRVSFINSQIEQYNHQLARHAEQHDHKKTEEAISIVTRVLENETQARKMLLEQREVQEYGLVLLKDNGIKARVIKKYIPVINKLINMYLAKMGFYVTFELNEQFQETIKTVHKQTFTYNSFSEGEKLRINLAILFAWRDIAKMRNSMSTNLLIMDEIFDSSLDDVGTEDFMKILETVTGDTNVFVISHKATMFDKFRSVIKFEKTKNFSHMIQDGAS